MQRHLQIGDQGVSEQDETPSSALGKPSLE